MGLTPNAGTHTSRGNIPPRQELVCLQCGSTWRGACVKAQCLRHVPLQLMHGQPRACLRIGFILGYPAAQYERPELP